MSLTQADDTLDLLAGVAKDFATRDAARVRAQRDGGGAVDREMWSRLADNGWLSIPIDEDLGGAGLGLDAVAIVARRLGYAAFREPFAAAGVLAPLVLAAAEDDGRDERVAALAAGELLAGVGWQLEITADVGAGAPVLTGTSRFLGVSGADGYAVAAKAGGDTGIYWVTGDAPGLSVQDEPCADGTLSALLSLASAPAIELVGPPRGEEVLAAALDTARVAVAAELVGVMDGALELTLDYLRQRKQFGRPIGSFQALQHRAVDAWMQRELASAALGSAIRVHLDPESTPRARAAAASSAKARASLAGPLVCNEALALHGAIGFTDEYDLGLYLNRALTLAPWLGNAAEHRRRYAELVAGPEDAR